MLHIVDIAIIFAFIAHAIRSGFKNKSQASESLEEYFLAGRSMSGWKAGISMAATQFAADTPLLVTGLIATAGIFSLWRLWIYALAFLLMGFLLARSWRRAGVLTDAELTELRYSNTSALVLRSVKAIYFGTIINCTVMAMVLLAATRIAEPFLTWNLWLPTEFFSFVQSIVESIGAPLTLHKDSAEVWILSTNNLLSLFSIVTVTTLYSTTGGLRSVIATDVLQFFLMMIATLFYAFIVIDKAGGMASIVEKVKLYYQNSNAMTGEQLLAFTPSRAFDLSMPLFVVLALQWLIQMNSDGTGYLSQRTMACKSDKDAKQAAVIFAFAQVFLRSLFWIPLGLGLIVIFPPGEVIDVATREATFVRGINEMLPIGIKGLMLTGMLAALASTIDTHLNWGAGYWSNDLYGRLYCEVFKKKKANSRKLVWVARFSNIGILFTAMFIMMHLDSIQTAWQASLILGASMGLPLVMRWLWWRMNSWGEIFAIVASLIMTPILLTSFSDYDDASKLLIMASTSLLSCLLGVYVMGPESKETLEKFYKKARPLGFWGPIAKEVDGLDNFHRKEFWRSLLSIFSCAGTIFCLLVAIGSLMVSAPAPTWLPYPTIWISLNFILGLLLIPVWLKPLRT